MCEPKVACGSAWIESHDTSKLQVACGSVFGFEIFGSCRSEVVESPGIVCVLKLRAYLHRSTKPWSL